MDVTVRKAMEDDAAVISGNNIRMAYETEGRVLDADTALKGVLGLFEDESRGFYIVAECKGEIAGQCMITYEWSDWNCGSYWWIQSVYVREDFRRKGIFRKIYEFIAELSVSEGDVCGLRLYVDDDNLNAIEVYGRMGFSRSHYLMFEKGL
ncbi:GNAT family N-acetyltransferase [Methanoplanus endosymbiosus]|uniref:GNAT family N-acetyltransferase n=1 Tax=Methanoplanus endosymbiosus TaxID=33865 RepID=A0A9E7TGZ4_9EURY|nr:GNAT family N-acetyltransferase [Methanoplanus endosymbiosus]UUX91947.1 GNAT family N-acetyltransferase [Methanoplanus endosymbiosus]